MITGTTVDAPRSRRLGLSAQVAIGLAAGVFVGLLVGERAGALQVVADAYVRLLQMTVLPYITLSLVGGLGALTPDGALRVARRVGALLLILWAIALLAILVFPLMFPSFESASFFSTTLLDDAERPDLLGLYIPDNPFNSLANNVVPAVVLFSALLGIALIRVPQKAVVLDVIRASNQAIGRVARFVVALTPFGLFAIAAVLAGTFDPSQASQLQVYLISYIVISLLLAFWVLPALVAALTPVPHRAILAHTRDTLIVAFTTGSLFVVLPLLADQTRELLRAHGGLEPRHDGLPDVVIPASFNFPHTAKLLSLSFVPFAAWFTGAPLSIAQFPALAGTGFLTAFGSLTAAIPFLLDMFRIPADTFQLFIATGVINSRFGTMLSAVHTLAVALLATAGAAGLLRIDRRKLLRFGVITGILTAAVIGGTRLLLATVVNRPYDRDTVLASMQTLLNRGTAHVFGSAGAPPLPPFSGSLLDRIRERRTLRVGYFDDSLPFAFVNSGGELVGFDVEMALQLARDLRVQLELVQLDRRVFDDGIDPAACDLVMSGAAITADRATRVLFSVPYLDETMALVVRDHRRAAFASWDGIRAQPGLRIGVPVTGYYEAKLRRELPQAQLVAFDGVAPMFDRPDLALDAIAVTAERGAAYTLLHPEYSVVVPKPRPLKVPLAYAIAGRDGELAGVVNAWIDLKRKDGTIDDLFAHWFMGRNPTPHERRWSIVDDVLHHRD